MNRINNYFPEIHHVVADQVQKLDHYFISIILVILNNDRKAGLKHFRKKLC